MTWTQTAQYASDLGALLLFLRVLRLNFRLSRVLVVFCVFIGFDLFDSVSSLIEYALRSFHLLDYRVTWICMRSIGWGVSVWLVYALVSSILKMLPGILRFSKVLLNAIFSVAILLAVLTVKPEITAASNSRYVTPISKLVIAWLALDRAISMALVLVIIAVLIFILWFPVSMPRNLAVLSMGLVVYFGTKTAVILTQTYWARDVNSQLIGIATSFVLAACFGYWLLFLSAEGQTSEVRFGHVWSLGEQQRLLNQLDSMNAALMRSARRSV